MTSHARPAYFLDLNVVIDYLTQRQPWYPAAKALFQAEAQERLDLYVSADSISTLFYTIQKGLTRKKATVAIEILLKRIRIAPVTQSVIERAFRMGLPDLEDGIQAATALEARIPVLVTRDPKDFEGVDAKLQILAPGIAAAALLHGTRKKG